MNAYVLPNQAQASYGYRPLTESGPAGSAMGQAVLAATMGAALGILFGIALAAIPWHAIAPTASSDSGQVTYSPAVYTSNTLPNAVQAASLPSQAVSHVKAQLSSPQETSLIKTSATKTYPAVHRQHVARRLFATWKSFTGRKTSHRHRSHLSHRANAAVTLPPAAVAAKHADAAAPFTFMIEGDLTFASFDASAGTLETNEGKTFLLGRAAGESIAASSQDVPANLHYRCDQAGNCTLVHAGIVFLNARLAT